jgi:glycosyltransferase involved in cell wall biosynthesis
MKELVSIVVPVYGVSAYIVRCLDSIIQQTYPEIECILVDDCSPDDSMLLVSNRLEHYQGSIVFKTLRHEKNRGLSAARNTGTLASLGSYVFYLDSDDELLPDGIRTLVDAITDEDFIAGKVLTDDLERAVSTKNLRLFGNEIMESYLKGEVYIMAWNKLIRRDFIIQNKLFFEEGLIHEDFLWSHFVFSCARKIRYIDVPTYLNYRRPDSITYVYKRKNIEALMYVYQIIKSDLLEKGLFEQLIHNYLIKWLFVFAEMLVGSCLHSTFDDYRMLIVFDSKIQFKYLDTKNKQRYLFFCLPKIVQYRILKAITRQ